MTGRCQAWIEDYEHPTYRASRQRITVPGQKQCSRRAKEHLGSLDLCTVHARLAREGFVGPNGVVESKLTISDCRRYGITRPNDWAKEAPVSLADDLPTL